MNPRALRMYMYNNQELTIAMPKGHRFPKGNRFYKPRTAAAKGLRPAPAATASGLSRLELRKIIIDLIG
jgi:hypothetical protein